MIDCQPARILATRPSRDRDRRGHEVELVEDFAARVVGSGLGASAGADETSGFVEVLGRQSWR